MSNTTTRGILERLKNGVVLGAEGYVFELERRGYIKAGPYVPEVVLDFPEAVKELHREFLRAGSEVMVALTYYAHREKLKDVGRENDLERMNRQAVRLANEVAREGDALVAGNICNTWAFDPDNVKETSRVVRAMYEEQLTWAVEEGVDFVNCPGQLFLVHGPHNAGGLFDVVGIKCPGIADIARDKRVTLSRDLVGKPHCLPVHAFEIIFSAYILQLFTMGVVGQGNHHLASRAEELSMQSLDCLREIKDNFWDIRPGLDIAPALKFKYISFGSLDNTLTQSFQDTPARSISHCLLLFRRAHSRSMSAYVVGVTNLCGVKR